VTSNEESPSPKSLKKASDCELPKTPKKDTSSKAQVDSAMNKASMTSLRDLDGSVLAPLELQEVESREPTAEIELRVPEPEMSPAN